MIDMKFIAATRVSAIGATVFSALLAISPSDLKAQSPTVEFGFVTETQTGTSGFLGQYQAVIGGSSTPLTYPAYNVTVVGGANGGELLLGQSFLAICVNVSYPGLVAGEYGLSTNGDSITYDIDGAGSTFGESWDTNQTSKYNAMRDIIATHGSALVSLATTDQTQFQYRITALNFVLAEIGVDGIADVNPLTNGNMQFYSGGTAYDADFAAVQGYYNEYLAAIGNGEGAGYTLYSAGTDSFSAQDVILLPIPEPGAPLLAGAAAMLGFLRRRRVA